MLCVLRSLFVAVISVSLIYAPIFALKANAGSDRPSQQTRNLPPLNT